MVGVHDEELHGKFRRLGIVAQADAINAVNKRVRRETELGRIFSHINDVVDVRVLTMDDVLNYSGDDLRTKFCATKLRSDDEALAARTHATYQPEIDAIVLRNNVNEIDGLLLHCMTPDGLKAHERLHAVQYRRSGFLPITEYLILNGHTHGGNYSISAALEPVIAQMIPGVKPGSALEYFKRAMGTQHVANEVAAHMLTPVFENGVLCVPVLELELFGLNEKHVAYAAKFVQGVIGKCAIEVPHSVDIAASDIVGFHGRDFENMRRAMPQVEPFVAIGLVCLRERSEKVLDAINVARDELRKYTK